MTTQRRHIDAISGLRALAVLAVVLFHINPTWLPGGFVGVDMFFVISGFVVAHSVSGAHYHSFSDFLKHFYARRFRRILPAAYFYIFVTLATSVLFIPLSASTKLFEIAGASAAVAASNVFLFLKNGDYFAIDSGLNPFTHTWSLAVEEQYYLLFPLFSYSLMATGERLPRSRQVAIVFVSLACLLSIVAAALITPRSPSFAFYMLPTRFWELGSGFLLRFWFTPERTGQVAHRLGRAGLIVGVLALSGLLFAFLETSERGFPFPGACLPCFATLLLLATVWSQPGGMIDRMLSLRIGVFFGSISYSLYLWHWGLLVLMRWTCGLSTPGLQLLSFGLAVLLGWLSFRLVERPFHNRATRGLAPSRRFFFTCAAIAGALCIASLGAVLLKPMVGLAASDRTALWDPYRRPPLPGDCPTDRVANDFAGGEEINFVARCANVNVPRLIVMGDSHAGAYQRTLWRLAAEGTLAPSLFTLGGCRLVYVTETPVISGCETFRSAAIAAMRRLIRPGDVVFLPGLHTTRYDSGAVKPISSNAIQVSRARVRELVALGATVIIEGPKPVVPVPTYRCVDWFNRSNPVCQPPAGVDDAANYRRMIAFEPALQAVTAGIPNALTWDPSIFLCQRGRCPALIRGRPLYFDTDHLSAAGNDLLFPHFRAMLRSYAGRIGQGERKGGELR